MRGLRRLCRNISRLYSFARYTWNDGDWDEYYIYKTLYWQIKRNLDAMERDIDGKYITHRISRGRMILRLLKKVMEREYEGEWQDKSDALYGAPKAIFTPTQYGTKQLSYEYRKPSGEPYSPEETEKIRKHVWELVTKAAQKQTKAERILWKSISENINYFWY